MFLASKIFSQSIIYFSGTIFSVFIGFLFKIFLARELGADMLGLFALGMSIVSLLSIFLSLGLGNGLVKYVSKYVAKKNYIQLHTYIRKTIEITLLMSVIAAFILIYYKDFIASNLIKTASLNGYMSYFAVLLIFNALISIFDHIIRGLQEVKKSVLIGHFIRLPLKIMVCYLFIHLGFNLEGYLLAEIVASILALLLLFKLILKILPNEMRSIFKNSKTAISKEERKFGNNMLILNIVGPLSSHADKITLAYFFTETEIGVNAICLSIIAFIPTVLISVNSIFAPIISELHTKKNNELLKYYYQNSSKYIFILTYPLIVFLAFFSEDVMNIFGQDFLIGSNLLLLLLIGELFNISSGSVGIILNMCGFDTITRNVNVLCSTIVVFFYILLIPLYGLIGVGIGRLMYVVLLNGINLFYLKRKLNIHPSQKVMFIRY